VSCTKPAHFDEERPRGRLAVCLISGSASVQRCCQLHIEVKAVPPTQVNMKKGAGSCSKDIWLKYKAAQKGAQEMLCRYWLSKMLAEVLSRDWSSFQVAETTVPYFQSGRCISIFPLKILTAHHWIGRPILLRDTGMQLHGK